MPDGLGTGENSFDKTTVSCREAADLFGLLLGLPAKDTANEGGQGVHHQVPHQQINLVLHIQPSGASLHISYSVRFVQATTLPWLSPLAQLMPQENHSQPHANTLSACLHVTCMHAAAHTLCKCSQSDCLLNCSRSLDKHSRTADTRLQIAHCVCEPYARETHCVDASVEDHNSLQQLSSAAAQTGVPTPEALQQLGVHHIPVHLNRHVELQHHLKQLGASSAVPQFHKAES